MAVFYLIFSFSKTSRPYILMEKNWDSEFKWNTELIEQSELNEKFPSLSYLPSYDLCWIHKNNNLIFKHDLVLKSLLV